MFSSSSLCSHPPHCVLILLTVFLSSSLCSHPPHCVHNLFTVTTRFHGVLLLPNICSAPPCYVHNTLLLTSSSPCSHFRYHVRICSQRRLLHNALLLRLIMYGHCSLVHLYIPDQPRDTLLRTMLCCSYCVLTFQINHEIHFFDHAAEDLRRRLAEEHDKARTREVGWAN